MADFITTVNRIATELRRSNMATEIKLAINDAIKSEAKQRFHFNEVISSVTAGYSFPTVIGQEYYDAMGFVEVDAMYFLVGGTRYDLYPWSNIRADANATGNTQTGPMPDMFARAGDKFRLFPIPSVVRTIYVDGYGKLTPSPLVADADTNNWLDQGEQLIRARAKAVLLKDIIKDFGEATVYEAIAEDYRHELLVETEANNGTGSVVPTQW